MNRTIKDSQSANAGLERGKSRSRRLFWWLVGMLVAVVVIPVVLLVYRYQQQMTLVTTLIDDYGGHVIPQKTCPDWLWNLLGENRMRGIEPIESISFFETPDEALTLAARTRLHSLHAHESTVSDALGPVISRMDSLKALVLSPDVGDRHYPKRFPETLSRAISELPDLESVRLVHFELSPETLKHLRTSHSLREIELRECRVFVPGVAQLAELKSLQELSIDTLSDGPALLHELSKLIQLTDLDVDLFALEVNDEDVQVLSRLKSLKSLNLNLMYTEATQEGIDQLQKALPKCRIEAAIGEG